MVAVEAAESASSTATMTALAAAAAADNALRLLRQSGTSRNPGVELYSFADMCSLLGFDEIYEQDARWAELTKD